jgi:hypothetical protein
LFLLSDFKLNVAALIPHSNFDNCQFIVSLWVVRKKKETGCEATIFFFLFDFQTRKEAFFGDNSVIYLYKSQLFDQYLEERSYRTKFSFLLLPDELL